MMRDFPDDDRLSRHYTAVENMEQFLELPTMKLGEFRDFVLSSFTPTTDKMFMSVVAEIPSFLPVLEDTPQYPSVVRKRMKPIVVGVLGVDHERSQRTAILDDDASLTRQQLQRICEVSLRVNKERKEIDDLVVELYDNIKYLRRMREIPNAPKRYDIFREAILHYEEQLGNMSTRFRAMYYRTCILHETARLTEQKKLVSKLEWISGKIRQLKMSLNTDFRLS